ncbi:MAG: M50 family metallopeptidase [Sulfolobales archaeon]
MSREMALAALMALVIAELLLYYLSRSSQSFKEKLSKLKLIVEPGVLMVDLGKRVKPRSAGEHVRYSLLALSVVSLVISLYMFYSTIASYMMELFSSLSSGGPAPQSPMVPVIPGITLGLDILIPLLISVGMGLVVHELFHMLTAIINGIPVESWGVGIALIFPVAYVRVSEVEFSHSKLNAKVSVLCAGIMANLALGLVSLGFLGLVAQPLTTYLEGPHMLILGVEPNMPAGRVGMKTPAILEDINGTAIDSLDKLRKVLNTTPSETAVFKFRVRALVEVGFCGYYRASEEVSEYLVLRNSEDVEKYGYRVGVVVAPSAYVYSSETPIYLLYSSCQLQLLYIVNVSLAIINSAPLIVTDGGRLISELLKKVRAEKLDRVIQWTTIVLTALIVSIGLVQSLYR